MAGLSAPRVRAWFEAISHQHAIPQILLPYLERVSYDSTSQLASQWNIADLIVVDPARAFGKPIVTACAMPTSILSAAYHANNNDASAVAYWYEVTADDVLAAVHFEQQYFGAAA